MNEAKTGARASGTTALAAACALVLGCALAGCTRPEPVGTLTTSNNPSALTSPRWTDDEQAAIDAVQNYLDLWTAISQNIDTTDWNRIYEVAGDPVAEDDIYFWGEWASRKQHLVGTPVITTHSVNQGTFTSQGFRKYVYTCYDATSAYLFNIDGTRVENRGLDRRLVAYTVVDSGNREYRVNEMRMEDEPC